MIKSVKTEPIILNCFNSIKGIFYSVFDDVYQKGLLPFCVSLRNHRSLEVNVILCPSYDLYRFKTKSCLFFCCTKKV